MAITDDRTLAEWKNHDEAQEHFARTLTPREYGIYAYAHAAKWQHTVGINYFARQVRAHQFAVSCVTEYRKAQEWSARVVAANVIRLDSLFDADYRSTMVAA